MALMPTLYAAFLHWSGASEHGFRRWHTFALPAVYLVYVAVVVLWIQPFGGGSPTGAR